MDSLAQRLMDSSTRRDAFEELVRLYSPQLYQQIRRMVLDHDDTNDVLQNTFMKAWMGLDNFRGEAAVSSWLFRIAMNESLTFLNKKREQTSLDSEAAGVRELESDPWFDGDQLEAELQAAIAQLPEKQRLVFTLRYYDEMKYEEMSSLLDTSEGALKASYHFAVQKLKEKLSEKFDF